MLKKKIVIPLPNYGFDPTEVAISWKLLSEAGHEVYFATPIGKVAAADRLMLTGKGLCIFKSLLKARKDAVIAYQMMEKDHLFQQPISYKEISNVDFDVLFLPGGHHKGVKEYLESKILQNIVIDFFDNGKTVAAICHGVVLLARSIHPATNKSVLYDYKTTALLKSQEKLAYNLTRLWLRDYYLTYPDTTVEEEVKSVLSSEKNFLTGKLPIERDSENNLSAGFVVKDRNYLSARWPGDVYSLSKALLAKIA